MRTLPLSRILVALVDDDVYAWASKFKWSAQPHASGRTTYVGRCTGPVRARAHLLLHREITAAAPHMLVDHINGNGLDNQRENIRVCTKSQNGMNQIKTRGTSRYKGVSWFVRTAKWQASIRVNGKTHGLGYYLVEEDAAHAYDTKAREVFGEFACLNFPRPGERSALTG